MKKIILSSRFFIHIYNNQYLLYGEMDKLRSLSRAQFEILNRCDGTRTYEEIYNEIAALYRFEKGNPKCRDAFQRWTKDFFDECILEEQERVKYRQISFGKLNQTYPILLALELTSECNHRCKFCYISAKEKGDFMSLKTIDVIIEKFANLVPFVQISGGEALLHKDFNQIILKLSKYFQISLITNGSNLHRVDHSVLKKINVIQVSLYGYDEYSYELTTGSKDFSALLTNISSLSKINPNIMISILINKLNLNHLESYIHTLKTLSIKHISFGVALPLGEALEQSSQEVLDQNELHDAFLQVSALKKKYSSDFIFSEFSDASKYQKSDKDSGLLCMAGKTTIIIGPNSNVRPCNLMPANLFESITLDDYIFMVENNQELDISNGINNFSKFLSDKNQTLDQIKCAGFCNV